MNYYKVEQLTNGKNAEQLINEESAEIGGMYFISN